MKLKGSFFKKGKKKKKNFFPYNCKAFNVQCKCYMKYSLCFVCICKYSIKIDKVSGNLAKHEMSVHKCTLIEKKVTNIQL